MIAGLVHMQDREGVVHLADGSPLGGLAVGCDSWEPMTVVLPDPRGDVCGACLEFWQTSPAPRDGCAHTSTKRDGDRRVCCDCGEVRS